MEEVGRVAQRLAQHRALAHRQRQLAALGHVEVALDADRVADVERVDAAEGLLADGVDSGVGLDRAGQVADVEEDRLAVAAAADHPAGDPVGEPGLLALLELLGIVRLVDRRDLVAIGEALRADRARSLPPAAARAFRGGRSRLSPAKARPSRVLRRSRRQADRDPLVAPVVGARLGLAQQLAHRRAVVGVVLERHPPTARRFLDQAADDVEAVLAAVAVVGVALHGDRAARGGSPASARRSRSSVM